MPRAPVTVAAAATTFALAAPAVAFAPGDRITKNGLGDVEIGMTIAQVQRELGRTLDIDYLHDESCGSASLGNNLSGLFSRGRIVRIYIATPRYRTRNGVHVGHRDSVVYARYGRSVTAAPHEYVPGGYYLRVTTRRRRVVFETNAAGVITQISTGRIPEIDYVEGCA